MTRLARVAAALREAYIQHAWDVQQLLEGVKEEDRKALIAEEEMRLPELLPHAAKLWRRVLEG